MSADEANEPNVVYRERDSDENEYKPEQNEQTSRLRSERIQLLNQFFASDGADLMSPIACRMEV